MILDVDKITKEEENELLNYMNSKGLKYSKYNSKWDCYVTDEMQFAVPLYMKNEKKGVNLDEQQVQALIDKCITSAIDKSEYLLSGDNLYEFIDFVYKEM